MKRVRSKALATTLNNSAEMGLDLASPIMMIKKVQENW